jgi:hypothetical protein
VLICNVSVTELIWSARCIGYLSLWIKPTTLEQKPLKAGRRKSCIHLNLYILKTADCRAVYVLDSLRSSETTVVAKAFQAFVQREYTTQDFTLEILWYTPKGGKFWPESSCADQCDNRCHSREIPGIAVIGQFTLAECLLPSRTIFDSSFGGRCLMILTRVGTDRRGLALERNCVMW